MNKIILYIIASGVWFIAGQLYTTNQILKEIAYAEVDQIMTEYCKKYPKGSYYLLGEEITCWDINEDYKPIK